VKLNTSCCQRAPRPAGFGPREEAAVGRQASTQSILYRIQSINSMVTAPYRGRRARYICDPFVRLCGQADFCQGINFWIVRDSVVKPRSRSLRPVPDVSGLRALARRSSPTISLSINPIHSSRSKIKGSTESARCAGIHVASSPSNDIARTTPANTRGSRGFA
jgi:hypothetical protein